jgi:hypothetical protein
MRKCSVKQFLQAHGWPPTLEIAADAEPQIEVGSVSRQPVN